VLVGSEEEGLIKAGNEMLVSLRLSDRLVTSNLLNQRRRRLDSICHEVDRPYGGSPARLDELIDDAGV